MSLGLMLAAVASIFRFNDNLASMLFVAALNYKQMELYHALPFFFYLLGRCMLCSTWSKSIKKLAGIGITVIFTFVIIWLPFLTFPISDDPVLQVCKNHIKIRVESQAQLYSLVNTPHLRKSFYYTGKTDHA